MRILISGEYKYFGDKLAKYGFSVCFTKVCKNLSCRTSYHSDLQAINIGNNTVFILKGLDYNFEGLKIIKTNKIPSELYPNDCLLNCLILGNKVFCLEKAIDIALKEYFVENKYEIVNVNQGYTKCSTLKIDDNSIISSDKSIIIKAKERGLEALEIEKGHIELKGYNYGFIGGASFVAENNIFFFGNIDLHPNAIEIKKFIADRNFQTISLAQHKLIDIGGAVIL